ncbi:hypothetical protein Dimus_023315 [Dionaea muscipula]
MAKRGRPRQVLPTPRGGEATRKDFAGGSMGKKLGPSGGEDSLLPEASHPVESERGCGSGKALVLSGNETDVWFGEGPDAG